MCELCGHSTKAESIEDWRVAYELRKMDAFIRKDKFEDLAAQLMNLLQETWDLRARAAIEKAIKQLEEGSGEVIEKDLEQIIKTLEGELAKSYALSVQEGVASLIVSMYSAGISDVAPFALHNNRALQWLQDHHLYWIGNHWDQQVERRIVKAGAKVLGEGLGRFEAGKVFEEEFGKEFKKSHVYWEGLSNHVTTRSREFGRLDGYTDMGIQQYQIVIVNDDRTSEICLALNGTIIDVEVARAQREKIMSAKDPMAVKEIAPWRKVDDILTKDGDVVDMERLAKLGVLAPPFHFNCRTRTVAI